MFVMVREIGEIDYLTGPFWSPNGDYFAFTRRGKDLPEADNNGHFLQLIYVFMT